MDIEIFYNKTELTAENDDDEKLLKWIEFRLPLIIKRLSHMRITIKEDIKVKGVQLKITEKSEEYNRLKQCEKCLFEYTKHLVCYKGGYQAIDQKEPCLLFKPKEENNCRIEIELDPDKKICKICDKQIIDLIYLTDSRVNYIFHENCLLKLKLLLRIKESIDLSEINLKKIEFIFGILLDDIPKDLISLIVKENSMKDNLNEKPSDKNVWKN